MRVRLSFQAWILGGCVLVVLCTLVFLVGFLRASLRDQMIEQIRDSLHQQTVLLQEVVSDRWVQAHSLDSRDRLADYLGEPLGLRVTLIAPKGRVLGDSGVPRSEVPFMENHSSRPEVVQAVAEGEGWSLRHSTTLGVDLLSVARLLGSSVEPRMILRLAIPLAEVEKTLARVRSLILSASLVGVLLAIGVAYLVSQRISRPVKRLTRTVKRIASGDLSGRMGRYPAHEIGELAVAFDRMADHLQEEIRAVTEARDRLETVLRGMVEGVILTDPEGRILLVNRALRRLLDLEVEPEGYTPAEIFRNADLWTMPSSSPRRAGA